jgi:Kef-type K+ transport system membrane component KefB
MTPPKSSCWRCALRRPLPVGACKTDYFAPLVIVQIIMGIILGPGVVGAAFPEYHKFLFNPDVVKTLNGVAQWGVMLFVMLAGIELDLKKTGNIAAKA